MNTTRLLYAAKNTEQAPSLPSPCQPARWLRKPRPRLSVSLALLLTLFLVTGQLSKAAVLQLSDIEALRNASASGGNTQAVVAGYYTPGDGGGGAFAWDPDCTKEEDGGVYFRGADADPMTGPGRWVRSFNRIDVQMFGAKGDGVTNDRAAIQGAIDAAVREGYPTVHFGGRRYYVTASHFNSGTTQYVSETTVEAFRRDDVDPIEIFSYRRGILKIGFHEESTKPRLTLSGEGCVIYTDDEVGGYTLGHANEHPVPDVFLVRSKFLSLTLRDMQIERKVTGGRAEWPGSYKNSSEQGPADYLSNYDRPNHDNRGGIFMYAYEAAEVEHVTLENVTFVDCHRAVRVLEMPDDNYPGYFGKLKTFNVDRCKFLYPYATNSSHHSFGPQTAMDISNWVETARITGNYFDGATSGNVSEDFIVKRPLDGFFQTQSLHLVCSGNKLRHFCVEGIDQFHYDVLTYVNANIAIPPALTPPALPDGDNTVRFPLAPNWQLPSWVDQNQRVYLGDDLIFPNPGFYKISNIQAGVDDSDDPEIPINPNDPNDSVNLRSLNRKMITLKNLGHPSNAPAAQLPDPYGLGILRVPDFSRRASCLIVNNEIDCSPVIGFDAITWNTPGYGYPAIRVIDSRAIVSGNNIINTAGGIWLYDTGAGDGRMRGSLVSGNTILLADINDMDTSVELDEEDHPLENDWFAFNWINGITIFADGVTVRNNTIQAPTAEHVRAIGIGGNDNRVVGNYVSAEQQGPGLNWGFLLGTATTGNYFADNTTENFYYGIADADYGNSGAAFTVASHSATGHEYAVVLPGRFIENTSGTLIVGNGSLIKKIVSKEASLTFGSVPAHSSSEVDVGFTGESFSANDTVMLGLPDVTLLPGLTFNAYVKNNDKVKVKATNVTCSSIDGGTKDYRVTVMQLGQ